MSFIPYGRQSISDQDIKAVASVLKSDWLTQGPLVDQFEEAIANYCGAKQAVAVSNGTAALHIACLALGVGEGDFVWTSPNTFVASANCALYCGAQVDFVDICPDTYNLSVDKLAEKLEQAEKLGKLPKVVIPVHFSGQSCDMQGIKALADRYGFKIIEDASHAIGGTYQGGKIGSCQYSDITVFSFHPVKVVTSGEGGMCLTNDEELARKLKLFRTHGITKDPAQMTTQDEGAWYYEQIALGLNYRITDMQCALGLSQLNLLDEFVEKRNALARRYNEALADLPLKLPLVTENNYSAFHLYMIQVLPEASLSRRELFDHLRANNIGVNVHYIPVHTQPYYQKLGFKQGDFPCSEAYYSQAITLPLFPGLTNEGFDRITSVLHEALK